MNDYVPPQEAITRLVRMVFAKPHRRATREESARQLLAAWMWECKLQGWMLDNQAIEELLQATERELDR